MKTAAATPVTPSRCSPHRAHFMTAWNDSSWKDDSGQSQTRTNTQNDPHNLEQHHLEGSTGGAIGRAIRTTFLVVVPCYLRGYLEPIRLTVDRHTLARSFRTAGTIDRERRKPSIVSYSRNDCDPRSKPIVSYSRNDRSAERRQRADGSIVP